MKATAFETTAGNVGLAPDELQATRMNAQAKLAADTGLPTWNLTDPAQMQRAVAQGSRLTVGPQGVAPMAEQDPSKEVLDGAYSVMASAVDNERTLSAYYAGIQMNRGLAPVIGYARVRDYTRDSAGQMQHVPPPPGAGNEFRSDEPIGTHLVPLRWGQTLNDALHYHEQKDRDSALYFLDKVGNSLTFGGLDATATGDWARNFEEMEPQASKDLDTEAQVASLATWFTVGGPIVEAVGGEIAGSRFVQPVTRAFSRYVGQPISRILATGLAKLYKPVKGETLPAADWLLQSLGEKATAHPASFKFRDAVTKWGGKLFRDGDGYKVYFPREVPDPARKEVAELLRQMKTADSPAITITSKLFAHEPGSIERAAADAARLTYGYTKGATAMAAASTAVPSLIHAGKAGALAFTRDEESASEAETSKAYVKAAPEIWWETEKAFLTWFMLPHLAGRVATGAASVPSRPPADLSVAREQRAAESAFVNRRLLRAPSEAR